MGEEKRHEMMETLFGAESEDSDDEPEPERQPRRVALSDQASDHPTRKAVTKGKTGVATPSLRKPRAKESEAKAMESEVKAMESAA